MPSIAGRLKNASRYLFLAYSPEDRFSLALLGLASARRLSFLTRHLLTKLVVRPLPLGGLRLVLNPSDLSHMSTFDEMVINQAYDFGLIPFVPDQIFDCGGHIGFFSLLARSRYPMARLTIFEPSRHNTEWIRRQAQLNAMNIEVMQAAVSEREGEAEFLERDNSQGGHLVNDAWNQSDWLEQVRGPIRGRYTVRIVDLPAMLLERRPERLLLKLDVEGEEVRIIPALFDVLPRKSAVFFETHHGEAGWDRAKQQFKDRDFAVERRRSIGDCVDGFALRC
jgi:FkbM family methyltransferase